MSNLSIKLSEKASLSLSDRFNINFSNNFVDFGEEDTEQSIAERFEQQVSKYKYATAIKTKNETITYNELNSRANRLARAIISERGTGNSLVALLMEQGSDFITGIFGVLKTGKFYVPIDPSLPKNRLTSIIEDSGTTLIVTNNRYLQNALCLAPPECLILNIDDIDTSLSSDNLGLSISPDSRAYVIYTSGSTGKPKGVLQNHRNALHNCMNNTNALCITHSDRLTLLHSCGVMGAMRGICNALLNGASLYPLNVKEEGLTNLVKLLVDEEITIYHSVTTLFRHFVSTQDTLQFPKLRALILGGEQVLQRDIELYKQHFAASCVVYVSLGSTETGTVRQFVVNKHTSIYTSTVPIGYPVEGMDIMLLDDNGREVENGCIGEIAVRSKYLALGYWQNPELTKAKFSIDPNGSGERIYRTGDLGRLESNGCLIHMGRKDFQVKIRGFRIEISEIEMALLNTGVVKETVVTAHADECGDKRLVAYVVLQNQAITANELRAQLRNKLPDYMLPSAFVFLSALPLTPNSKVNRLALPIPEFNQLESNSNFVAARNHIEHKLVEIWEKALGVHPIGITHNFFDLGGHSLLAVQIFGQIEKQFGKKLPLATLLQAGTIEALAAIITSSVTIKEKISWSSLVTIQPNGAKPPLFLMHPLGGEILVYRKLSMYLGYDQPVYGLQPVGLNGHSPHTTVEDMAAHYIREMQIIQPHGPYLLGGYSFGGVIALEVAQQLLKRGEEVAFLCMLDTCRPGCSTRLPLLERIYIHIKKLLQQPTYIQQKFIAIKIWSKFHFQEQYQRYAKITHNFLQIALNLPDSDEHLNIMQANAIALSQYCFQQKYPGQLTLFRTADENRDDNIVGVKYDPEFGWTDIFTERIDIHHVPGSHLTLLDEPNVEVIAQKLKASLGRLTIV